MQIDNRNFCQKFYQVPDFTRNLMEVTRILTILKKVWIYKDGLYGKLQQI